MTAGSDRINAEAATWAVRISAGPLDTGQQATLDAWLDSDVRHQGALIRAQAVWVHVDRISALLPSPDGSLSPSGRTTPINRAVTRRGLLAAGLSGLLISGIGGLQWFRRRRGDLYETAIGEVRRIALSDGSSMLLDSGSVAHVHFRAHHRDIELVRGQGLFEVAKDASRPFVVYVRDVSVRALGTVFAVRAVDTEIAVTVTEGAVEIADYAHAAASPAAQVTKDERAVISASQGIKVQTVNEAEVERHLSWRNGILSFEGESLAVAVAEINRHSVRQIAIDDVALGSQAIVGVFRAGDAEGFAQTVAAVLAARSVDEADAIHLHPLGTR
jgi:transmembrane sensor